MPETYRIVLSDFISADLEDIADFITLDNPARGIVVLQEIRRKILLIGEGPLLYQLRPDIGEGARLAISGRYVFSSV